ncbi:hypothetical protein K461DRAFT_228325 [Myriangium duriaei CBS 260.36]|uniref:Uncharacterized protein n=1 Tax=Myriangium duriaei CBS 260.36 TaxID=1168546 RepID=A0A9P4MEN0_9PEZI|nr:hypothetical protein K461DRAFT_228325 [Myriangium duriaei CBS 260.36]
MADIYQSFLRSPSASHLASDAALHYITTTSSIRGPDAVVKHLQAQERQIQKKEEKILSCIQGGNGICLETETTFVFRTGGGLILPNMDENMLADTTVICPMIHVVSFDNGSKISQIRLYWDQGTMLKQVEAIGKTGRNWPIKDGKEQAKLMKQSIESPGQAQGGSATAQPVVSGRQLDDYTKRLFATGSDEPRSRIVSGVEPRESAKPQQRQWGELFAGEEDDENPDIGSPSVRSPHLPILKSGAGKNYKPNRLFDKEDEPERSRSPERKKVDPTKNEHFEFGNGEDALPVRTGKALGPKGQRQVSNWDFDDFSTPAKHVQKPNPEQERHFGYGIDEDDGPTPLKRPVVHAPRPDAKTNFDITDENTPEHGRRPMKTTTNVDAARRHADHDPHFNLQNSGSRNENVPPTKPVSNVSKARSDMVSNFSFSQMMEEDPAQTKKIYKTAGDGMGGRAGTRFWDVSADDAPDQYGGQGGQKQVYKTYGNGMGGRKGQGLGWSIGDPDAE